MRNLSLLEDASEIWQYWGFEPWSLSGMEGVYRRVTFVKGGFIGEVARYYADDYIIWGHRGRHDIDNVLKSWKPQKDVMIQRFLFVEEDASFSKKVKAFWLGFKGYLEVYRYSIGGRTYSKIKDLTPLVEKAWELVQERNEGGGDDLQSVLD